jgi:hypothetical protein
VVFFQIIIYGMQKKKTNMTSNGLNVMASSLGLMKAVIQMYITLSEMPFHKIKPFPYCDIKSFKPSSPFS